MPDTRERSDGTVWTGGPPGPPGPTGFGNGQGPTGPGPGTEFFKANNPKDAFGTLKACLSWLPMEVVFEVAIAMAEGGFKYGGHNYLVCDPRASVYMDAINRHQFQFWNEGESFDAESQCNLHHLTKLISSAMVLRAAQIHGRWIDDRPPRAPAGFLQSLNEKMKLLAAAHPDPVARYLADNQRGPGRIITEV